MPINLNDPRLQVALNRVNMYRSQAGVPPCRLEPTLVQSAQAHAEYIAQNGSFNDPHGEQTGQPGFTGATFFDRAKAAGYRNPDSTNENVAYLTNPQAMVDAFMPMINHRTVMLDPSYPDIGFGFATTPDGKRGTSVIDFGMPVWKEVFDPAWVLYPGDGGVNFGLTAAKESNDPFAAVNAVYPIGNTITVQYRGAGEVSYDTSKFSLTDAAGTPIPIYALSKLPMFANRKSAALASQKPLQPNTTYTVTIGYNVPGHSTQLRTWRFSTGPSLDNSNPLFDQANLTKADQNVRNLWMSADGALAAGKISRTWFYGPKAFDIRNEPYVEAPGGQRQVYYFDKARMEITNPGGDRASQWFVTTGRLVYELMSGQMQVGNNQFEGRAPATLPVAGDPAEVNPVAPTYASLGSVASLNNDKRAATRSGAVLEAIDKAGQVRTLAAPPVAVNYAYYDNTLGHNVPDVFMRWMNTLPNPWVFVLGLPMSEPYWTRVKVRGVDQDVLIQVFERRALTYNPANDPAWQVEMGNVGQHYHVWRYGS
jgi:hypothetical protein